VRAWVGANDLRAMIVWVVENSHHARGFYEAMGGRVGSRLQSRVGGFPVVELSYIWDRL